MVENNKSLVITEFVKNKYQIVRISLTEYKSMRLIDIRVWSKKQDSETEFIPTTKGVSLSIESFKNLMQALPQVEEKIKELKI